MRIAAHPKRNWFRSPGRYMTPLNTWKNTLAAKILFCSWKGKTLQRTSWYGKIGTMDQWINHVTTGYSFHRRQGKTPPVSYWHTWTTESRSYWFVSTNASWGCESAAKGHRRLVDSVLAPEEMEDLKINWNYTSQLQHFHLPVRPWSSRTASRIATWSARLHANEEPENGQCRSTCVHACFTLWWERKDRLLD